MLFLQPHFFLLKNRRKLICAISVCNTLTVGVDLSSTPSISGPGSATVKSKEAYDAMASIDTRSMDGRIYRCPQNVNL